MPGLWFLPRSQQVWFRGCPIEGAVCLTLNGLVGASKQRQHPSPEVERSAVFAPWGPVSMSFLEVKGNERFNLFSWLFKFSLPETQRIGWEC